MLIHVDITNGLTRKDAVFSPTTFKDIFLKESHLEEFIRSHVEILFVSENGEEASIESLLIVGQHVVNSERGKSDLMAIDGSGRLVLIEIKRDLEDIRQRKEPFEFQAIMYAAGLATIKTQERLIELIYAPYIEKHRSEESFREYKNLTASEIARRKLDEFLKINNASETFNQKQRILLVASEFDAQTLSAISWLIANGVDFSCFTLNPGKLLDQYFVNVEQVLPLPTLENNYVDIYSGSSLSNSKQRMSSATGSKQYLPRIPQLFEWDILKQGDILTIANKENSEAEVLSKTEVRHKGEAMTYNEWGKRITGWSTLNIYLFAVHKERGKTLDELRAEKMQQRQAQSQEDLIEQPTNVIESNLAV
ncbi:conserved hypothetical protein [Candidatus Methylobacter favarea]|uniref:RAMA domain-containing protein n=1 Tax=Candidatus Methylobacter favarea TaxID=2707345 RepID=A0A8S0Y950_9GAMM|nr:hypothetical protein [Candidatus Methylobacter favarea]CAA9889636.1 conserved hypothetical protein [Candidatus Methylobacter favarea]